MLSGKNRNRILGIQKQLLVDLARTYFLETVGHYSCVRICDIEMEKWENFAGELNAIGPAKTPGEWKNSLTNMQSRVLKKSNNDIYNAEDQPIKIMFGGQMRERNDLSTVAGGPSTANVPKIGTVVSSAEIEAYLNESFEIVTPSDDANNTDLIEVHEPTNTEDMDCISDGNFELLHGHAAPMVNVPKIAEIEILTPNDNVNGADLIKEQELTNAEDNFNTFDTTTFKDKTDGPKTRGGMSRGLSRGHASPMVNVPRIGAVMTPAEIELYLKEFDLRTVNDTIDTDLMEHEQESTYAEGVQCDNFSDARDESSFGGIFGLSRQANSGLCGVSARGLSGVSTRGLSGVSTRGLSGVSTRGLSGVSTRGLSGVSTRGLSGVSTRGLSGVSARGLSGASARGRLSGVKTRGRLSGIKTRGRLSGGKIGGPTSQEKKSHDENDEFEEECKRIPFVQKERLLQLLQNNFLRVVGRYSGANGVEIKRDLWEQFAKELNTLGPDRTPTQWKKTLDYMKGSCKKRLAEFQCDLKKTGGGSRIVKDLTEQDEILIAIFGLNNLAGHQELGEGGFVIKPRLNVGAPSTEGIKSYISSYQSSVDNRGNLSSTRTNARIVSSTVTSGEFERLTNGQGSLGNYQNCTVKQNQILIQKKTANVSSTTSHAPTVVNSEANSSFMANHFWNLFSKLRSPNSRYIILKPPSTSVLTASAPTTTSITSTALTSGASTVKVASLRTPISDVGRENSPIRNNRGSVQRINNQHDTCNSPAQRINNQLEIRNVPDAHLPQSAYVSQVLSAPNIAKVGKAKKKSNYTRNRFTSYDMVERSIFNQEKSIYTQMQAIKQSDENHREMSHIIKNSVDTFASIFRDYLNRN